MISCVWQFRANKESGARKGVSWICKSLAKTFAGGDVGSGLRNCTVKYLTEHLCFERWVCLWRTILKGSLSTIQALLGEGQHVQHPIMCRERASGSCPGATTHPGGPPPPPPPALQGSLPPLSSPTLFSIPPPGMNGVRRRIG